MKPKRYLAFSEMEAVWLLLRTATDCLFQMERWADLTWMSCESDYRYTLFGTLEHSLIFSAVFMAIAPSKMRLQISSKCRLEAVRRRQRCFPPGAAGFLILSCLLQATLPRWSSVGQGQTQPAWLPGPLARAEISSHCFTALSSLLHAQTWPSLFAGLNQLSFCFDFSKITPLLGSLCFWYACSDCPLTIISLNMLASTYYIWFSRHP